MKKGLLITGIALMVGGIAWHFYNQYKLLMQYCFNIIGHKIVKLSLTEAEIDIYLEIKNKSSIDATITSYDFDVFVNDKPVSKVKNKTSTFIKGNGVSNMTIPILFNPKKAFKNLSSLDVLTGALFDKTKLKIGIKGVVSLETSGISIADQKVDLNMTLAEMMPNNKQSTKC